MATKLSEFSKGVKERSVSRGAKCAECQIPLQETITGSRSVEDGKCICRKCVHERAVKLFSSYTIVPPGAYYRGEACS